MLQISLVTFVSNTLSEKLFSRQPRCNNRYVKCKLMSLLPKLNTSFRREDQARKVYDCSTLVRRR